MLYDLTVEMIDDVLKKDYSSKSIEELTKRSIAARMNWLLDARLELTKNKEK